MGWAAASDPATGRTYYTNSAEGRSSWERPAPRGGGGETIVLQAPSAAREYNWRPGGAPRSPQGPVPSGVQEMSLDELTLTEGEAVGLTEGQQAALLDRKRQEARRAREVSERQAERLRREMEGEEDDGAARGGGGGRGAW